MNLRIFSFVIAFFFPPFSVVLWLGSHGIAYVNFIIWCVSIVVFFEISFVMGILTYLLVMFHAFYVVIFHKSNNFAEGEKFSQGNQARFLFHIMMIFTVAIIGGVFFGDRVKSDKLIVLDNEAIAKGKELFNSCKTCHRVSRKADGFVGPHLADIFGRKIGSLSDYKYSKGFIEADFVWNDENLVLFLQDPKKLIPSTRMATTPISKEDATNIVTYLKSK